MNLLPEARVNTYRNGEQTAPDTAALTDGSYVTVWMSAGQDGSGNGIYAQRYGANGAPLGAEVRVNTPVNGDQSAPHVAGTSDGGYVVIWEDNSGRDGSAEGVYAQRFNATGVPQGANFLVNTTTSSTQYESDVVAYAGGFATVWTGYTNNYDIYLQRWDNAGNKVGVETLISTTPGTSTSQAGTQQFPEVAARPNGDLFIVWVDQNGNDGSSYGVYGRRYTASTGTLSDSFLVNTATSSAQYEPSVALLADGTSVVVWRSDTGDGSSAAVYGQRFDTGGAKIAGEFLVNQTVNGGQYQPSVTALSTGGFVVAFYNDNYDTSGSGTTSDVYVREYSAAGVAITGQVKLISATNSGESQPVVVDLGGGRYVVTYTDASTVSAYGNDIAQQIFGPTASPALQLAPSFDHFGGSITFNENLVNTTPQVIEPVVGLFDPDSTNFDGGQLDLYWLQGWTSTDQLGVRSVGTGANQISVAGSVVSFHGVAFGTLSGGANGSNLVVTFNAAATVDAVEELIQNLTYATTSQSPAPSRTVGIRVSDGDGGASVGASKVINVTPEIDGAQAVWSEEFVNSYTPGDQVEPEIAVLADGSYVIVWQSNGQETGSSDYGIYAQRFTSKGVAMGAEVRVNTLTGGEQSYAHAAALQGAGGGGYVVTWQDNGNDGSSWGIYSQRYDASGNKVGAQTVVNTTTSNNQYHDSVASYNGGYAVVWTSVGNTGGNGYDIYLKRYDNSGAVVTDETRVSTTPGAPAAAQASTQELPDVAAYANGNLVIVWQDTAGNDGSGYGVYGRTYNAGTGTFSDTFLVNTNTSGNQYEPSVATLAGGGFVVVWRDDNQDGSSAAVYGQMFSAAGAKLGGEFLVNETTSGGQYQAAVTALSTGGFVVSFYNDNYDTTASGTTSDVYIRQYDAAGNPVDGQRKLVSNSNSTEYQPAIADLGGGNFVVAYADYNTAANGGNNTYEIAQQVFGSPATLTRQADPVIGDFTGTVTFLENAANATPQIIDSAVSVSDIDSTNFAGGQLDLYYIYNAEPTDQLGVRNVGNGPLQIGVSGSTVSYGGTPIGIISGGTNGTSLSISFNAAATPEAVQVLIQSLTYATTSQSPDPSRTVALRISDGDGGSSDPSVLTINVTAQLDGAPVVYGESPVNTYTAGDQAEPEIAVLADGSYVIVWQSNGQETGSSDYGVFAQRFTSKGVAIGAEVRVNTLTSGEQSYAHAAALQGAGGGGYVVTWQDNGNDGSGWGIYSQRYDASGNKVGAQTVVNTTTSNNQYHDSVASYNGGYTVVWTSVGNTGGNSYDIYLKRYDNSGALVTDETRVSTTPGIPANAQVGNQELPDVAAYANGNLVIVWQDTQGNDGSGYGVYGRTYNAAAGTFSDTFLVNTNTGGNQYEASVATLAGGGFVVVWRDDSKDGSSAAVVGQLFNAAGTKVGGEFLVNESTTGGQYQAAVAGLSTGGFVVSFYNDNYDTTASGTTSDVYIREYDASANAIDGQRKLISNSNSTEYQPAVADLGGGNFVVAYADYNTTANGGNNTYEIAQQIFGSAVALARQSNPQLGDFTGTVTFGENLVNATPQVIDAAVSLTDTDSADFAGGAIDLYYVKGNDAGDQLGVRNGGTGAGQIGVSGSSITYGGVTIGTVAASANGSNGANLHINLNAAASVEAVESLIQNLTYGSSSQRPDAQRTVGIRVSDGDGGSSNAGTVLINVTPELDGAPVVYGESQVNTYNDNTQDDPEIAVLNDGSYVVVWTSYGQDSSAEGVYGQRFSPAGVALGSEFRVNTVTANTQNYPHAAALSSGGFVVVWQDNITDGSGYGVYAQRYDGSGAVQGANTLVNTTTSNNQYHGVVASYTGGYTVAWSSFGNTGGNGYDIYIRRFDNSGNQVTAETRVSTTPGAPANAQVGTQELPDIAAYANGNLVIVWQDTNGNDGSSNGVYGRTYNAAAGTFSDTFLVNTFTTGAQYEPSVATLADGGFIVVWRSDSQDGSSAGVYGQRYTAAGAKAGGEFLVNEQTTGGQYQPAVTGLSTGGFVVTWYNDNYDVTGAGTTSDTYIREYNAAGVAIDGERKLQSNSNSTEYLPTIADLGNGNYVVAYADYNTSANGGNNTYEIAQQIFGNAATLTRSSANPVLGDLRTQTILSSAVASPLYAGNAQVIDGDVAVSDSDSADFSGGQLLLNMVGGLSATDVLAVRNQGAGAGQIGVAGANVSYGGVVIGTVSGGGAGASSLTVTFNASASAAAVRALVENITYQNTAPPAGTTNRYVSFRITDGDGGASDASVVLLTIQAAYTPPVLLLDDVTASINVTETAARAGVLVDDAVALNYTGSTGFNNGHFNVSYASSTGRGTDQLSIRNEGAGAGQVGVVGTDVLYGGVSIGTISATLNGVNGAALDITFKAAATDQAIERVVENLQYLTTSSGPLASRTITLNVTDGASVSGTARNVVIGVSPVADPGAFSPLFGEDQVNTYEAGQQVDPSVDRLQGPNAGGYVVAWTSQGAQDGSGYGVFAQRYDAKGAAVGSEFQVNTQTLNNQTEVSVGGLSSGGYVIAWRSDGQDGSGSYGVYAQRYAADGSAAGPEFLVNTTTTSNQYQPTVTGLSDGTFVIAYYSDYSNAAATYTYDVLAQRYAADGTPLGAEFTVNVAGGSTQSEPRLAALSGGGFVAIYSDSTGDASGYGVEAQVFTNAGVKVGAQIAVNTTVAGQQSGPDVAALAGGGFVAVWWSTGGAVYAQQFSAAGAKIGGEIAVNTTLDSPANQTNFARVAGLESGGFIVTWDGYPSASLGGSSQDVMAQQFDAAGNRVDGVKLINTTIGSTQYVPDIVGLTGSNAVVAWAGYNQETSPNSTYGVFQQLLGTPGSIVNSAAPLLVDVTPSVTFAENLVNATPQLIDSGVSLTDSDSANFDGGHLWVSTITGYGNVGITQLGDLLPTQDQLGIRNQGSGVGQIGVAGNSVSYGGTVIGTIVSGGANGADLDVVFNTNASAQAVEAVIENLTYGNSSSAPVASRTVSISVSDGDGGTSVPRTVVVNVTPEADGAQPLFSNEQVNTYVPDTQETPVMARLSDGGYITVWASTGQDGWAQGVFAQRFDSKGVPLGAEFRVNTYTPQGQYEPTVTALNGGGYVVAWRSDSQDGSGTGVYAQRFSTDGLAQGGEFRVNTDTDQNQYQPNITATADGGFVVSWYDDYYTNASNTEYRDIFFQRYNAAGVAQGAQTRANPSGEGTTAQDDPAFAGLSGGGFVAVWEDTSKDGSGSGVYGQRFDAAGNTVGASFRANTYTASDQFQPAIAALNDGGYVVTWTSNNQDGNSYGVFAQRYNSTGTAVGSEFRVNTDNNGNQSASAIAALSNGGFAISYFSNSRTYVQQFDVNGNRVDGELLVDTRDNNANGGQSSIIALANGSFVVAITDYDYTLGNYNVYQQIFGNPVDFPRQANPVLVDVASTVTFAENTVNATPQLIDGVVGLSDADSPDFGGGTLEVNYLTGYSLQNQLGLAGLSAQDQLGIRNQGSGVGQIGVAGNTVSFGGVAIGTITSDGVNGNKLTVQLNANATVVAVEHVIESLTYANTFSDPSATRSISIRVTDGDGGASIAQQVTINVTPEYDGAQPLFSNERVNTYEPGTQSAAVSTLLNDGSYVTVWQSETPQDGWGYGVYAQRFSAQGVPLGTEFQVHTYTPGNQYEPTVAALKNGGYVVAWRSDSQDGSGTGVYAQRYTNDGAPQGSEFLVNTTTSQNQYQANAIGTADGGFVIAWYDDYYTNAGNTEYRDVMFQRYDANGVAQGAETRANPSGEGTTGQFDPAFVPLAAGGFVAIWTDDTKDGSSYGIYGRRFDASGTAVGGSFLVNTYTSSDQSEPSAAPLNDGGYVVVWTSNGEDSSSYGVYGQRYNAAGAAVGGEFRVNTNVSGNQYQAQVSPLSTGGFVVTWNDGSTTKVQQYDATGVRVDGEIRVDTLDNNANASVPDVLGLGGGAFVVSWTDYDYNTSSYNVYQQVFGNPATLTRQANPQLEDVNSSVTFGENLVNAVPQLLDGGVGLIDTDSPNFAGGTVEVNYLTGYGAQDALGLQGLDTQDQLGVRNQGAGDRQIGVAGNTVSYGGVAIGTITSNGANGNKLTVTFNANATADAVEHVIENITYANSVSNPIASRTVSIRVTDGDGGASDPRNIVINVTPETDGAVKFGLEKIVNTTVAGSQMQPDVARLADGGYVVVWEDQAGADGSSYGVYGQRYDANDNAIPGGQFRVNTFTSGNQYDAQVVGLAGGGYVVAWRSDNQDGSGTGVYAQRYNADGTTAGTEFRVNTTTTSNQYQPTLDATADGGFVVAWYHDSFTTTTTDYYEIYFQRYNASGVAQGTETRATPSIAGNQFAQQTEPSLAWLKDADGGFVVTWTDNTREGNSTTGVYAQRFTAAGVTEGGVLHVNSYISNAQGNSSVAALKDGGFVVSWESEGQDLSSTGIYAQRFDAFGAKSGAEFRVNTTINSTQIQPSVTALENGGWAVSWYDAGVGDVYVQQFDVAGRAVDGETRVNSYTYSTQQQPAIASMADGGFVVSYAGYISSSDGDGNGVPDGGNDTYEIRLQRFSNTAPTVSNVTVNGLEDTVVPLTNTLFEGGFVDPEGQSLQAIRVITLPAFGTLKLNNVAVTANQEISLADLQAGLLTYQGNPDYFGNDQFRWTGSDGIAFATTPVFTNIVLANVNDGPRLGNLSDTTGSEGSFFSRQLVIGDPDPEGHQVTVNWGDGSANTVFTTGSATPSIGHTYADNGGYAVTVTVDDQQGQANSVESKSFNIAVANVAPTIALSGANTVEQGQTYSITLGNPVDPGTDTVNQYTINWGDGSPPEVYTPATLPAGRVLTHVFTTTGPDTITVGLRDEDGSYATAGSKAITVSAPAESIVVDAGADVVALEGTFFSHSISFTDPSDQGAPGRTYTVNWGDGQTSNGNIAAGVFSFNIGHTYADNGGPYNVLVTVDDSGAVTQQGSDIFQVTVNNVAPTVSISGPGSVNEGSLYTVTINSNDPGTDTISQYVIHWGDGSDQTYTAATLPANHQLTHTYADGNANFTISVDVTDEDGTFAPAGSAGVFVANVAPTAPVTGANTVNEGSTYTLNVGAVTDPGQDTRTGYSINWGDGTPTENYTPAQWAAAQTAGGNFTHIFADGAAGGTARTITVNAGDEDGLFVLGTKQISVANVAPTVTLGGAANTDEAATYTLSISASDPAGAADPLSYTVDWGDGSAVQSLTAAQLAAVSGNVTHVYADDPDGPVNTIARLITVTADDGDGGITPQTKTVNVNNVAPTAPVSGAASVNEGSSYALTVGTVVDPGPDTRTGYSISWGDGNTSSFTPAQWATAAGNFTHTYADGAAGGTAQTITVSATDEDGTFTLGTKSLTVNNVAPTVALAGNANTNEGSAYSLTVTGSDPAGAADPLNYTVDWGDGTAVQNVSAAQLATTAGVLTHVYADDENGPVNSTPFTITVTANDGDGGITPQTKVVNVNNVAPTISLGGGGSAQVNVAYVLALGAITDPGTDTVSSYLITWGDGSAVQTVTAAQAAAAGGSIPHTYTSAAAVTISVGLVDEDGTFNNAGTQPVTVSAATPTVSIEAGPNASLNEGSTFTRSIAFADGSDDGAAGWSYSIDYGDGTISTGTTLVKNLDLSHVYADGDASRTVTVSVTDVPGETASDSFVVTVNNVAPTAPVTGANSVNEGSTYTLNVGTVVDPGQDTRTGYTINWGDGNTSSFTAAQWSAASGVFTHIYADGAAAGTAQTITVNATDEDGTFTLGTKSLTVNNVAPTVVLGGNANTNEGSTYSLSIAGSDPAGAADPLSYEITWGDGSAVQTVTAAQLAAGGGIVTHVYADDENGPVNSTPYTVSVKVSDDDGGNSTQTKVVTVDNVAPTAPVSGANSVNEGSSYALSVGAVVDPGTDTRTAYSINWGDGNTSSFTPAQWATAAGNFTHVYADGGSAGTAQTITVSATDEDGTFTLGTKSLTVNNVAPTVVLAGNASTNEGSTYSLTVTGSDPAGAADPLNYTVDWGDGTAVQNVSAAQLATTAGVLTHVYADDENGPVNSTPFTITVTANDGDGGITPQTKVVNVNNVAPTIALGGGNSAQVSVAYVLALGAITDPGTDTVSSYLITWGDGSAVQTVTAAQAAAAGGNIPHTYTAAASVTISVGLVDEDGTFNNAGTQPVTVSASTPAVSLEAGPNASLNEGSTFTRSIAFADGSDDGAAGWSYSIDYGDGTISTGTTLVKNLDLSHVYADGDASRTVTVSVTDVPGETASDSFVVTVNNVAPTAPVTGANSVNEGSTYTLNVGTVVDPGQDTRTGYGINWGDGNTSSYTAAQWAAAGGSFTHVYADGAAGGTAQTITVTTTDEDGIFTLGTKSLTVNNLPPTVGLAGNANTNEGSTYNLTVTGSDPAGAADPLNYTVDWGDGTALQSVAAAQLASAAGVLSHIYTDDEDGPINSTPHTITVMANDGDGGITAQTRVVNVDNVAPTIALGGTGLATVGTAYTLNLGAITDPGTDTVTSWRVSWGDGSAVQVYGAGGNVTHTYTTAGNPFISVALVDEDGTFNNAGTQAVTVSDTTYTTVRIGDAPVRQSGLGGQWQEAWTHDGITAVHKADYTATATAWTAVKYDAVSPQLLTGGDIYAGDLGVSGQSAATSTVRQEIDGKEALRFNLDSAAHSVTLNLSNFFMQDDGGIYAEAGRLRLIDGAGHVVGETVFQASAPGGNQLVSATGSSDFVAIELMAGAYDGGNFVFGAYGDGHGGYGAPITTDAQGKAHGSDFLVDWVEFSFAAQGTAQEQAPALTNVAPLAVPLIGIPEQTHHAWEAYT